MGRTVTSHGGGHLRWFGKQLSSFFFLGAGDETRADTGGLRGCWSASLALGEGHGSGSWYLLTAGD